VTDLSNIDEPTRWLDVLPRQARITIGAWAAPRVLPMIGAGPPGAGKLSVDPDEISAGQPDDDENGERFESGASALCCGYVERPQRIIDAHPSDRGAQIRVDLWPTLCRSGLPTPQ
jgi:hypothetical protein